MADAAGSVFWVSAGADDADDTAALGLGDGLALWLDVPQPASVAAARVKATLPTIRVGSRRGRIV
jgi:hypothetical protein